MYGDRGTDPQGLRYEAGKYLVQNLLVKEAPPDASHRIAVIHFGNVARSQPLTDLVPGNAEALAKSLPHAGKHLRDTSCIEALREARRVMASALLSRHRRDLNETGQEISAHPDYPLTFTARAITPKKDGVHLQFLPARNIGDVYEVFGHSYPYLDVVRPGLLRRYPLSDNFAVELGRKRDEAPMHLEGQQSCPPPPQSREGRDKQRPYLTVQE